MSFYLLRLRSPVLQFNKGERVSPPPKKIKVLFGATATSVTKKKKGRLSDRIRNSISYETAFVFHYQSVHSGRFEVDPRLKQSRAR